MAVWDSEFCCIKIFKRGKGLPFKGKYVYDHIENLPGNIAIYNSAKSCYKKQ
jgi:hypothetical protein